MLLLALSMLDLARRGANTQQGMWGACGKLAIELDAQQAPQIEPRNTYIVDIPKTLASSTKLFFTGDLRFVLSSLGLFVGPSQIVP